MSHIESVPTGSVVYDSLPFSQGGTLEQAEALKASGATAIAGYLGVFSRIRLQSVLAAGLGFIPVTMGGAYLNGAQDELAQLADLQIPTKDPSGLVQDVFLDMEGLAAYHTDPTILINLVASWANAINAAGYCAKLYAGVPQPLTSDELWKLPVKGYWKGQGSLRDRSNNLAEPTGCGWQMTQMYPSVIRAGVLVDCSMVGQDFKGRTPTMVKL